jgi:hypothetical protein
MGSIEHDGRRGGDRPRYTVMHSRGTIAWSRAFPRRPTAGSSFSPASPGQPYAPESGWDWGSNGRLLNNLVVLAIAHELTGRDEHRDAATLGMDYPLGCNALGQLRDRLRHRLHAPSAHPPFRARPRSELSAPAAAALAGGPTSKAHPGFPSDQRLAGLAPQQCYLDESTSETTNDVCIRWNAQLVWMAAFLAMERDAGASRRPVAAFRPRAGTAGRAAGSPGSTRRCAARGRRAASRRSSGR